MKRLSQLSLLAIIVWMSDGCSTPNSVSPKSVVTDPNGNFHLYVSNQSFAISPVDIEVFIDGEQIVNESFDVGSQDSFKTFVLRLSPGRHKIVAESSEGHAKLEQTIEVDNKLWAALAYWSSPKSKGDVESYLGHFSVDVKKVPIYFL
jgi:hypothetical protein